MGNPLKGLSFQALFEAAADALLLADGNGRIVLSNEAVRQMLGYTEGEITGLTVEHLMPMRFRASHSQHRQGYSKQPSQRSMGKGMELVALCRDGKELAVEISLSPLPTASRAYTLAILHDITARKEIEQKFLEQRSLTESLFKRQVAVQTVSAIAHELNQPLTAISAYGEVALQALDSGDTGSKTLHASIKGCVKQAQRAGQVLHELLAFLQKDEIVREPMDVNEVVRESLAIVQNDGYGGFHLKLRLKKGLPQVLANRIQLQKVLVNLLRNGVEAMRQAGVPMATISIKVQTLAERNMAQVTVKDSGPGLDTKTAQRIFDPFFSTKSHGIGMGLAISRALVEANGGQLWVDQESTPGATFHFTIPFAQ